MFRAMVKWIPSRFQKRWSRPRVGSCFDLLAACMILTWRRLETPQILELSGVHTHTSRERLGIPVGGVLASDLAEDWGELVGKTRTVTGTGQGRVANPEPPNPSLARVPTGFVFGCLTVPTMFGCGHKAFQCLLSLYWAASVSPHGSWIFDSFPRYPNCNNNGMSTSSDCPFISPANCCRHVQGIGHARAPLRLLFFAASQDLVVLFWVL
ncbi:hypothetical protein EDB86DRAFT_197206 [Lactarius hatsudake]|nr:hypothetical protein EDB86DRAFT_197206 [Lactarius hatsudake]